MNARQQYFFMRPSIMQSEIWVRESREVVLLLFTMAAMGYQGGVVRGHKYHLKQESGLHRDQVDFALNRLIALREIEEIEDGWRLLNPHGYFRFRTAKQIYDAERQRLCRERKRQAMAG